MFQFKKITDLIAKTFSKPKSFLFSIQTLPADFHESYSKDELKFINALLLSGRYLSNEKDYVIYEGKMHFCADDTMLKNAIASLKGKANCDISADTVENLLAEVIGTLYDQGIRQLQLVLYHNGNVSTFNLPDLNRVIKVIDGFCMLNAAKGRTPTMAFYEREKEREVFMLWDPPKNNFQTGDKFAFDVMELDTPPAKHGFIPVFFTYESAKKHLAEIKDPRFQIAIVNLVKLVKFVKGQFTVVIEPFTNYWLELTWPDQNE